MVLSRLVAPRAIEGLRHVDTLGRPVAHVRLVAGNHKQREVHNACVTCPG